MKRPTVKMVGDHLTLQIYNSIQQTSASEIVDILIANLASILHTINIPPDANEETKDIEQDRCLRIQGLIAAIWTTAALHKNSFRTDMDRIDFVLSNQAGSITILAREKSSDEPINLTHS